MSRFGYCSRNQDHDDCSNRHCAWRPYTHAERGALRERNNAKAALRWRACASATMAEQSCQPATRCRIIYATAASSAAPTHENGAQRERRGLGRS